MKALNKPKIQCATVGKSKQLASGVSMYLNSHSAIYYLDYCLNFLSLRFLLFSMYLSILLNLD